MSNSKKYVKLPVVFLDKEQSELMGKNIFIETELNVNTDIVIGYYSYFDKDANGDSREFVKLLCAGNSFTVPLTLLQVQNIIY